MPKLTSNVGNADAGPTKRRLSPEQRRELIIERAIAYFAEMGFESGTRELAARMDVSQPLLYKYFPNKEDLIRAVYERVYLNRWKEEWTELLGDRTHSLADRTKRFYRQYADAVFHADWLRIYLFSGLKGVDINRWYIEMVETKILRIIVREFRTEAGLPNDGPIPEGDLELAWILQGGIFYYGLRKYIYQSPVAEDLGRVIDNAVNVFFTGINATYGIPVRASGFRLKQGDLRSSS